MAIVKPSALIISLILWLYCTSAFVIPQRCSLLQQRIEVPLKQLDSFPSPPRTASNRPLWSNLRPDNNGESPSDDDTPMLVFLATAAFFYLYWLIFGAAAKANGLPFIPDFLPMVPGWPPSQQDLHAPLDDAYHFFYLSELLKIDDVPYAPPTRLALFNVAEAWIFAFLPVLWKDPRRLPRPVLLGLWAILGINVTNAFLAPYLLMTALFVEPSQEEREKNSLVSKGLGGITTAVAAFALYDVVTMTDLQDWQQFATECSQDRTYFAFVVDSVLFSIFQPYVLKRAKGGVNDDIDYVPFVGLVNYLFE